MVPVKSNWKNYRKTIVATLSFLIVSSGAFLFFGPCTNSAAESVVDDAPDVPNSAINTSLTNRFIANEGQWSSTVKFIAATNFGSAAFASGGFYYYLPAPENVTEIVSFKFVGASGVAPAGTSKLLSTSNYLIGSDPSAWRTDVPEYGKIVYSNLWDGVDLVFFFVDGELKYELTVAAGTNADIIAVQVSGAVMEVRNDELVIATASNTLIDRCLVAYYADDHTVVDASFTIRDDIYSFEIGRDISRTVVIDPLVCSTYLGGSGEDEGNDIAVDTSGGVYVTGYTASTNFPVASGAQQATSVGYSDAFVAKFNADGSLAYSTYLGGSNGDNGNSIAVDQSGHAYVTGYTDSNDFPTTDGAVQTKYGGANYDAFVTKLTPTGGLAYSTYLGGYNYDHGNSIAVDSSGCAYVTGEVWSGNFPITSGAYQTTKGDLRDIFVTKLNADGSALVYSTFLGGNGTDIGYGIAVDTSGCAYVTGYTYSTNFPVTDGAYLSYPGDSKINAFVTKLSADGSALAYSTYLGGSGHEIGHDIAVDASGCAHVTGHTTSANFPIHNAFQSSLSGGYDAFITKFNADGSLAFSTYLGGSGDEGYITSEHRLGIAVDLSGFIYVGGFTTSTNFPVTSGAYQTTNGGSYDVFVAMFGLTGGLVYATYLGGGDGDYGHGVAVGSYGCVYLIGETRSSNFPITNEAYQPVFNGAIWSSDAFVTKLSLVPGPPRSLTAIPGQTNVSLTWTAPTKSASETLDDYAIYQDGVQIAIVTNTAFLVTGLATDQDYAFSVSARNALGEGPNATVSARPGIYVTVEATASSQYANADTGSLLAVDVSAESELPSITLLSANVSHHVDGVLVGNEQIVVGGGSYSNAFSPPLAMGTNVFTYTFNDSVGNSISKSVTVVYDVTVPTLAITSPTDDALFDTGSVTISWTASDDLSGVAHFDVSIDGAASFQVNAAVMEHTFSGLADGHHLVSIIAVDRAGNEHSVEISFIIDTTAPTIEIFSPADTYINTSSPTMQWTTGDATSGVRMVEYSIDGTTWVDADDATIYLWSGLADGAHTFYVRAEDNASNSVTKEVSFIVDTVAPTLDILSPTEGSYLKTSSVMIGWTTADDRSGVAKTEYSIDGLDWTIATGSSCSLALTDDSHTVLVRATDNAGNVYTTSVGFVVDIVAPSLVINSPTQDSFNNTGSVTVSWTASDATSGIRIVQYSTDGTIWIDTGGATSFTWSGLADGLHTFYLRTEDNAGNQNSSLVSFVVDTISPSLAIDKPINNSFNNLGSVTVEWTASDDRSGIAYFDVNVMHDGAPSRYFRLSASEVSKLLSGLADGAYIVTIGAVDNADNINESTVRFVVDTVEPTIGIISPAVAYINADSIAVQWTASDATSGVRMVEYSTDGADWIATIGTTLLWSDLADGSHTFGVRATDYAGNSATYEVSFIVDTVAPTIDRTPTGNNARVDEAIDVSFSEPMNKTSVSITVNGIAGTVSWNENFMTFTPSSALAYGYSYTVTVSGKDLAGNELSSSWSFMTMKDEGVVSGNIMGMDGNPVVGATVTLGGNATTTDGNGRFVLRNVTSGMYDLTVSKDGYEALTESVTVIAGENADVGTLSVQRVSSDGALFVTIVAVVAVLLVVAVVIARRKA